MNGSEVSHSQVHRPNPPVNAVNGIDRDTITRALRRLQARADRGRATRGRTRSSVRAATRPARAPRAARGDRQRNARMRARVTAEDMPEFGLTGEVDAAELNAATEPDTPSSGTTSPPGAKPITTTSCSRPRSRSGRSSTAWSRASPPPALQLASYDGVPTTHGVASHRGRGVQHKADAGFVRARVEGHQE